MSVRSLFVWLRVLSFGLFWLAGFSGISEALEILISDRLTNSVFRYSPSGAFIGTLLTDSVNLNQPAGLRMSPDLTKLYVTSTQNNRVVRYDYNYDAGTATNPFIFGDGSEGLTFPNSVQFSQNGQTIYVSNLGKTGVAQFDTAGNIAGPAINGVLGGGSVFQYSGLAWGPGGQLLVGGFQDFPAGTGGTIARSDAAITTISDFIGTPGDPATPSPTLNGVASLAVKGNDLYATAGFAGRINKYDATTGAVDGSFSVSGLAFPASVILAPDGNSLLVGILGISNGSGKVSRFALDGTPLGTFALAQLTPATGFREATGMVVVPEPSSLALFGFALVALFWCARRRRVH